MAGEHEFFPCLPALSQEEEQEYAQILQGDADGYQRMVLDGIRRRWYAMHASHATWRKYRGHEYVLSELCGE